MSKNIAIIVTGFIALIFAVSSLSANRANSQGVTTQRATTGSFEYAVLSTLDDGNMTFHAGETNVNPQVLSVETLYRRLGGNSRPNFNNLLNEIGSDGWELVTYNDGIWTFKRRN